MDYEYINQGRLQARKIGRRTLILKEDVEAFLAGLERY
ncbi:helix-turn-helix domain-containing protein [Arsenicibacter rosenii]